MDFLTRKEYNGLKGEVKASEYALEAEKYTFQKQLMSKYGPQMIEELNKKSQVTEIIEEKPKKEKKRCWFLDLFK